MAEVIRVESQESRVSIQSYRDLIAWQKAMDLLVDVYGLLTLFPKEEQYGLVSQIKRAAVSIPSNLAEGSSRRSTQEFIRYINIASGSLAEMETQLIAAKRLSFIKEEKLDSLLEKCDEISRIMQGLHDSLKRKQEKR